MGSSLRRLALGSLVLLAGASLAAGGSRTEWSVFERRPGPVLEGWAFAASPSVVRDADTWRLLYADHRPDPDRLVVAEAVSVDGTTWAPAIPTSGPGPEPPVLDGSPGGWDAEVGTPSVRWNGKAWELLYAGRTTAGGETDGPWQGIGLAVAADGVHFERSGDSPLLERSGGWYDALDLAAPAATDWMGRLWMLFTGRCTEPCGGASAGTRILGASSLSGTYWSKQAMPVLEAAGGGGVSDPDLVRGPDGLFYLFHTVEREDRPPAIGIARSPHPLGPWEAAPGPVLEAGGAGAWDAGGVRAPSAVVDGATVRLWYEGRSGDGARPAIGEARAPWPLMRIGTSWVRDPGNPIALPFGLMDEGETDLAIADPMVLWDAAAGIFKAWWSTTVIGIYGPDGPPVNGIRYAESADGVHWEIQRELAFATDLGDPTAWDGTNAETPFVVEIPSNPPGRRYLLYYSGGNDGTCTVGSAPCYEIGLAFSPDGRSFSRLPASESPYGEAGLVLRGEDVLPGVEGTAIGIAADPALLVESDGTLRMWMSSYAEDASGTPLAFGIAHASSSDGIHWTPTAANPLPSLRRTGEIASGQQPSVLWNPATNRYEMWFTNDRPGDTARVPATLFQAFGFWHATSTDGIHWDPEYGDEPDFRWDPSFPGERWGLLTGVHVMLHGDEYRLYYSAWSSVGVPPLFTIPTQRGTVEAITALCLARRPAPGPSPRRPAGRVRQAAEAIHGAEEETP